MGAQASNASVREYDKARMLRIGTALYGALLTELKDENGMVYIPFGEVEDACALMLGVFLSTTPEAAVPSQLRKRCESFAKKLVQRTQQAANEQAGDRLFDVVLPHPEAFN